MESDSISSAGQPSAPILFTGRRPLWFCLGYVSSIFFPITYLVMRWTGEALHPREDLMIYLGAVLSASLAIVFPILRVHRIRFEDRIVVQFGFGKTREFDYEALRRFDGTLLEFDHGKIVMFGVSNPLDLLDCFDQLIQEGRVHPDQLVGEFRPDDGH